VAFRVIRPDELEWTTRPHEPEEAPRHVAELTELAGFVHTRANVWRYEPGAKGRRHRRRDDRTDPWPDEVDRDRVERNTFRSLT
jgi:hypothetical protein